MILRSFEGQGQTLYYNLFRLQPKIYKPNGHQNVYNLFIVDKRNHNF